MLVQGCSEELFFLLLLESRVRKLYYYKKMCLTLKRAMDEKKINFDKLVVEICFYIIISFQD